MKAKFTFILLLVSLITFSSAHTVFYNTYNDEILSSYSIVYDDHDSFTRTVRIIDRYDNLEDYYYYSKHYKYIYDRDYDYKYWKHKDYRRTSNLDEDEDYYIYESPYRNVAKFVKCYDEAPENKMFYTRCP
jgi:hypothetical protein